MQKYLRIALATDWFFPRLGGIELHLANLSHALAGSGHAVTVLTTTPGPANCEGTNVARIPSLRVRGPELAVSPMLVARFKAALAGGHYDLVHAHISVVSPASFAAIAAARSLGLPVVVTGHSMLLHATHAFRFLDSVAGWSSWPMVLTAVSRLVAEQGQIAASGHKVLVLSNGVDRGFWARDRIATSVAAQAAPSTPRELSVVSAMRLNRKKRPRELVAAFAVAAGAVERAGRRLRLTIAGVGPERRGLEADIERLGLAGRVALPGALSREDLATLYAKSDIFVLPSIREAFGIAALEARCAGLPVVTMQGSGAIDFLQDGVTGLFAGNDQMLATHIARLALDDDFRLRLAAPDAALARFDWPNVVAAHVACYERAIALVNGAGTVLRPAQ